MATKSKRPVSVEETTLATAQTDRRRHGPSVNRVSLIGRLTADPEMRYTSTGIAVTSFRLANNGTDQVQYYTINAWRGLAEVSAKYLAKGRLVYIGGRPKGRSWTAPDGTARYTLDIVADEIQFLSPKPAAMRAAA
jgi:single-strand DNA-binding protein